MNGIRCLVCEATIISRHRHDCRSCDCPEESGTRVSVDGGNDYRRRGFGSASRWVELSDGRECRGDEP